jgi:hypothetical protein
LIRIALISGWIGHVAAAPRVIAVHRTDFDRVQGFDEHEIFAGDSAPALELVWRLQLLGTPVFDAGADELALITPPPWWKLPPISERPIILSVARLIWPRLCDESRIEPMLRIRHPEAESPDRGVEIEAWPAGPQSRISGVEMLLEHRGYNILRCGQRIIGTRQSLGPFDPTLRPEDLAVRYAPTDLIVRDSLDGVINAIDLVKLQESIFSFQSGYVRHQMRSLMRRLKPLVGRKLRRLGFRIDDPNSRSGRLKHFIKRELRI